MHKNVNYLYPERNVVNHVSVFCAGNAEICKTSYISSCMQFTE